MAYTDQTIPFLGLLGKFFLNKLRGLAVALPRRDGKEEMENNGAPVAKMTLTQAAILPAITIQQIMNWEGGSKSRSG